MVNLSWRSSENKSSSHGAAAFHGGVLPITQKNLYVRTAIAMVPFHLLPIDAPPWQAALPSMCIILSFPQKMMKNSYVSAYP